MFILVKSSKQKLAPRGENSLSPKLVDPCYIHVKFFHVGSIVWVLLRLTWKAQTTSSRSVTHSARQHVTIQHVFKMTDAANKLAHKHTMPKATHQRDWRTDSVWQTDEYICHHVSCFANRMDMHYQGCKNKTQGRNTILDWHGTPTCPLGKGISFKSIMIMFYVSLARWGHLTCPCKFHGDLKLTWSYTVIYTSTWVAFYSTAFLSPDGFFLQNWVVKILSMLWWCSPSKLPSKQCFQCFLWWGDQHLIEAMDQVSSQPGLVKWLMLG